MHETRNASLATVVVHREILIGEVYYNLSIGPLRYGHGELDQMR